MSVSWLKLTVPLGAVADVGVLSVTVAVQLLGLPTGTDAGAQRTTVLVSCWRAVTTKGPQLLRGRERPPLHAPHAQVPPALLWLDNTKLVVTAPVVAFVLGLPGLQLAFFFNDTATTEIYTLSLHDALPILSVTVAVQLLGLPTGTDAGAQRTTVLVSCWRAVTTKVPELLRWLVSPP